MAKRDLILLALDDERALKSIQDALQTVSYETTNASDRTILKKIIKETIPALVIIEEQFDGIPGIKSAGEILERFPAMPIFIYSEQESFVLYKDVIQAGLSGCLYPPLRNEDITSAVERGLNRARLLGDWLRREVKRTTASLKRRAKLTKSELNRYQIIFANIQDGVVILDEEERILLINKGMEVAFELSGKDLRGKLFSTVIDHPDVSSLLNRGQSLPLKYHTINFDDGRTYNAQYTPIGGIGSVITMQEISNLKQLDRLKNEFVNTISHDLRSPLTAVLGYTDLLNRVGSLNEQQLEFLNKIRLSMDSITALVNDLLDMSRLEAGFDTRREHLKLENILKIAQATVEPQLKLKDMELHTSIGKKLPELNGNPIRIRQVLDNLLANAVKYSPEGSTIRVSLKSEDNQIIFSVSDEGAGIPLSEQPRVFEKFYRASNVSKKVGGSGLGLAIVKSVVDWHQGRVWVESKLGEGSTFFVVLPTYNSTRNKTLNKLKK
ncbi:MAG: ATP-binding protein [Anaerolineae bacterium]|nr:ATP-binding protein [Anaerolineae bacterium]MDK1081403.1 ATP-binding protein [Anaerolineae bacterium]MDK1118965.1 ATP-binding protein [Anaerolineae bacterium]